MTKFSLFTIGIIGTVSLIASARTFNSTVQMTSGVGAPFFLSANNDCDDTYVESQGSNDGSGRQVWTFEEILHANDTYLITVSEGRACTNVTLAAPEDCYENSVILGNAEDRGARERWTVVPVSGKDGYYTISSHARYGCDNTLSINRHFVELRRNQSGSVYQQWYIP